MQRPINEDVHLRNTFDPNYHTGKVKPIDVSSNFNETTSKVDKLQTLLKTRVLDKDVLDYHPGMQQILYQRMIYGVNTKRVR